MVTVDQARAAIANHGYLLSDVGAEVAGWVVVSREYAWFKHSRVYFTIVVTDPDGQMWQFTVSESTEDGTEVEGEPTPVSPTIEVKSFVTFRPRLIPRI
ncbi:Uncharacterised protein [Mycobacteroides abscessus subsp. abscessus]|uniref:PepSY domain-containing protein n=1 Tax=Mycobacteroides abscessus TaxID=36809 RepID=A0AB33TB34_9MYCO|nr:hypothetical protein [Mycobacteroides abscessus]MDO3086065.1 hypothetical protein [Mycobacteroides abscessus subsp. abscessus]MDO3105311.1 hypothetical protein [Mycobacteroides abscessus subsp. abscessus]PVA86462.1 hypothetical protein DDJ47_21180 [Mycobacteroides abscessus]RIT08751.1 hypothetical protein D2E74_04260 [Mycobacteroides abscessus]RIT49393.1 hypothetical protein D2E98_01745 [Mycobacteroides abscessus]